MTAIPHDAVFKSTFEDPAHAAALFRSRLPPTLALAIDWDSLTLEPGSFVDPSLGSRHSDLLFSARLGDSLLYLYLLLEHQSRNLHLMSLRSLGYIVRKWEQDVRDKPESRRSLPLMIALVVSHAPEGWTSPVCLHDLVVPHPTSHDGLSELVPGFRILVDDLAHLGNEELKDRALATFPKLVLWALRDARDADRLLRNLSDWLDEFREALRAPSGIEAVSRRLRYIALVCQDLYYERFCNTIREQLPEAERSAMTMAEELIQMGRTEGLAQGRTEGRAQAGASMLVRMLERKFIDIPPEYRARIDASAPEQLEMLAERTLFADTFAAVFADE